MSKSMSLLRTGKSAVSLEALSVNRPLASTVVKLANYLSDIGQSIDLQLSGIQDTLFRTDVKSKRQEEILIRGLGNTAYVDLAPIRVPVIPGLSVTWLEFLNNMRPGVEFSSTLMENTIEPFKKFLAVSLSNPEKFSNAATVQNVSIIDFELLKKALAISVHGNVRVAVRQYGDCVKRNADVQEVLSITHNFEDVFSVSNPNLILNEVHSLRKMIDELSGNITDTNQQFRLNGKTISNIASLAYNIAEAIEYYGIVRTMFISHNTAMREAVTKLVRAV